MLPTIKTISLIIPVYNEQDNLQPLYKAIRHVWKPLAKQFDYELILVNDGSRDNSHRIAEQLARRDTNVKYIEFSRNFGKEIATSAGLHHVTGDAALMLDADLQHPPELIPTFIKEWQSGADIVVGVREANQGEGAVKHWGSKLFYRLFNLISDAKTIPQATDFRLLDREVLHAYDKFTERNRLTRGLIDWMGFRCKYVPFTANARHAGVPAYTKWKLMRLAFTSFISHSLMPLKVAGYLGVAITALSLVAGIFVLFEKYIFNDPWNLHITGPASLGVFTTFLIGIVLVSLGLIALYIGTIYTEIINRPMYVVRRTINIRPETLGVGHRYE